MKAARAPNLEERIKAIRAEINSIIDERVDTVSRESPGVPTGVIRNLLIARAPSCPCAQYLDLSRDST